jgi:CRISPR-associated endonuclease/helicase Cas3
VDLDFPVVFRVLAPADSLQQAAGRANREGRNPEPGRVVIFEASDTSSPPSYRTSVAQTTLYFGPQRADPDDLAALDRYYSALYASLDLEHAQRGTTIRRNADGPLRDPGALGADRRVRDQGLAFRMLDDDSTPVAITTTDLAARLVDELRTASGPVREVLRALQPYIVGIQRGSPNGPTYGHCSLQ